jgi:predicted phage terminase large subunit-like protein
MSETNPLLDLLIEADRPKSAIAYATQSNTSVVPQTTPRGSVAALTSYWKFIEYIRFKGGTENFGAVHRELAEFISTPQTACTGRYQNAKLGTNKHRRRLVLIPRGHLKSTLCSVGYVLWRIYRNPNIRIAVGCATQALALQFVREIKQYLENEDLQDSIWNKRPHIPGRLVPTLDKAGAKRRDRLREDDDGTEAVDKKIVWRSDAIQVIRSSIMREPTVLATSPGSNVTGMHFDLIIKDDLINDDTVATPEKIEKTLEWAMDIESVLDPQRKVLLHKAADQDVWELVGDEDLVLGTRYARHDYYDYIIESADTLGYETFTRNVYKNGVDSKDGYLWPEKFNDFVIDNLKKRVKPRRFASQYLNSIIVEEEQVLKMSQIVPVDPRYIEVFEGYIVVNLPNQEAVRVFPQLVLDPAISQKKTADNTVMLVGGVDFNRNLYLFEFVYGKFLPEKMISAMFELAAKWKVTRVTVEVVAFQKVIAHMIRSAFGRYRPIGINEYIPKGEKKARILTYLEPVFNNKMVYANTKILGIPQFREEVEYFSTNVNSTVHDDFVDAMAILVEVASPTIKKYRSSDRTIPFAINSKYGGIY